MLAKQIWVSTEYRSEVFSLAMLVINRLKTPTLNDKSHFECLMGRQPDYTLPRTMACECYPLLPKHYRRKLMEK